MKTKIVAIMGVVLASSGCSLDSADLSGTVVRVNMEGSGSSSNTFFVGGGSDAAEAPGDIDGFDCFLLNVTGPGIEDFDPKEPRTPWSTQEYQKTVRGEQACTYGGVFSEFIPVTGGTMEVRVPAGPGRLIQIMGMKSPLGCPTQRPEDFFKNMSSEDEYTLLPVLVEVGRAVADVYGDVTLDIRNEYDPNNIKPIRCGDGDLPMKIPGLVAWYSSAYMPAGTVNFWEDLSGHGNGLTGVNSPGFDTTAFNNTGGVVFAGSNFMEKTGGINGYSGGDSGFSVFAIIEGMSDYSSLVSFGVNGTPTVKDAFDLYVGISGGFAAEIMGGGYTINAAESHSGLADVVWATYEYGFVDIEAQASGNFQTSSDNTSISINNQRIRIGLNADNSNYANGRIGEVLIYNRYLTTEVYDLTCYLYKKYNQPPPANCGP